MGSVTLRGWQQAADVAIKVAEEAPESKWLEEELEHCSMVLAEHASPAHLVQPLARGAIALPVQFEASAKRLKRRKAMMLCLLRHAWRTSLCLQEISLPICRSVGLATRV